jgi:geranylgeranyl diphosphate synthase type II
VTKQAPTNGVSRIPFARRVLLLPHCLRPSQDCPGKSTKQGLDCTGCTHVECAIYQLRASAVEAGYGGICVAPGGRLAVRFLVENQPAGVVAVACHKELEEGLEAVNEIEWENGRPSVATVPLLQDGCVDTVVDVAAAREVILSDNGHAGPHPQSRCVDDPV